MTVGIDPLSLSLGIDRIPDVRVHLPANYTLALRVFGFQLLSIRLCGEAQLITEPYRPNPCEICDHRRPGGGVTAPPPVIGAATGERGLA